MLYIFIAATALVAGVLYWSYWENGKLEKEVEVQKTRITELVQSGKDRMAKADFMLRELGVILKKNDYKKKTYLCGLLDALEWATGDRPDEQFAGWVLAKKQVSRKEKGK